MIDIIQLLFGCWTKNRGGKTPQIIHFNSVFHYFHHPFWGKTPIFGNTHLYNIMYHPFLTKPANENLYQANLPPFEGIETRIPTPTPRKIQRWKRKKKSNHSHTSYVLKCVVSRYGGKNTPRKLRAGTQQWMVWVDVLPVSKGVFSGSSR